MSIPENITIFIDKHPDPEVGTFLLSSLTYQNDQDEPIGDTYVSEGHDTELDTENQAIDTATQAAEDAIDFGDAKTVTILLYGSEMAFYEKEKKKRKGKRKTSGI